MKVQQIDKHRHNESKTKPRVEFTVKKKKKDLIILKKKITLRFISSQKQI